MADNSSDDKFKFGFDNKAFETGINKLVEKVGGIEKQMQKSFNPATVSNFAVKAGASMAVVSTLLKGMFSLVSRGFQAVARNIPEIGTTFQIAGDIIMKNLLWPLRKFLIPVLQQVLDWVRDNRVMFVKMGQVIANVFRMVVSVIKGAIEVLKVFWDMIKRVTSGVFGGFKLDLEKMFNLLIFKITVVAEVIKIIMEDIIAAMEPILIMVGKIGKAIGEGWLEGFQRVFDFKGAIEGLQTAFGDLFTSIKKLLGLGADEKGLKFFKSLGEIFGAGFAANLQLMARSIELMLKPLTNLVNLVSHLIDVVRGAKDLDWSMFNLLAGTGDILKKNGQTVVKFGKSVSQSLGIGGTEKKNDFIITKSGRVIEPSPDDTIIGTKSPVSTPSLARGGKDVRVTISHIIQGMLQVTEGSAARAGQNFVRGVADQVRDELQQQVLLQGGY